jgi:hypothetical protein
MSEKCYQTSNNLNTLFKNPNKSTNHRPTELTVIDQTHPLFGKSFPILSVGSLRCKYVLVTYKDENTLRIPITSTNLIEPQNTKTTKLNMTSLYTLISLAEESKLCHVNLVAIGKNCQVT